MTAFKSSDIMVMGVIFIQGNKKEEECMLLTQTSGHSVPLWLCFVKMLSSKKEKEWLREKITRATFISAPLKAQQEEVAVFAKLQKRDTVDGGERRGEGEAGRRRGPVLFYSLEKIL